MYQRILTPPDHSFFLFGPRATGKSTWLAGALPRATWFDLLDTSVYLKLTRAPDSFADVVTGLRPGSWVVVDEVQKIPELLNSVHSITTRHPRKYKFALSGSSARKLKRLDVNLLAGRVINRSMFPLVAREIGEDVSPGRLMKHGSLPMVVTEPGHAGDILSAYVVNYLQQEVQQEALVENMGSFSRFLEVAAVMNGQVVNVSGLARDSGVARPTVQRYFDVLVDTLIGSWIRAWQPKARIKETAHPRFYFFDCGVVRAITGRIDEDIDSSEKGALFETLVLQELRAANSYLNKRARISYWRTPSGSEVDFIWSRGSAHVGFEVKSATSWRREWSQVLNDLLAKRVLKAGFGVYQGRERLRQGAVTVLPFSDFARGLYEGEVI